MPDPMPHLHAAHAALHSARRYIPTALTNLHHDQGGLPGHIAAWPTGHTATATLDNDHDPHDPCRRDLRNLDHDLHAITTTTRDLLDITHPAPPMYLLQSRHHYATTLVELATHATLTRAAYDDCDRIHHLAINIRNTFARWAYKPAIPNQPADLGLESPDWCANHARLGLGAEPVAQRAADDGHTLCDFCWSYLRGAGQRPTRDILNRITNGKQLTTREGAA